MAIIGTQIPTDQFFWDKATKIFSQEASTLRNYRFLSRLYNDACDTGFVLVSHKTGRKVPFYLVDEVKNSDGDVEHWEFAPAIALGSDADCNVIIFND